MKFLVEILVRAFVPSIAVLVFSALVPKPSPAAPHCRATGHLPDPVCTPGEVLPLGKDVLCSQRTRERRAVAESERREVFASYGLRDDGSYVLDHRVPLCLGGTNGRGNLWPQREWEALDKDRVESRLCRLVCAGKLGLEEARAVFEGDWEADGGEW